MNCPTNEPLPTEIKLDKATLPAMKESPRIIYLKDYRKPDYLIPNIDLTFAINETATEVTSNLEVQRNSAVADNTPLVLNGVNLKLLSLTLDGKPLDKSRYEITDSLLTIHNPPAKFQLEIKTQFDPSTNKSGMGLYRSGTTYCTQMEAEGFRNVTFFSDRPDVMSRYTTTIIADKNIYPQLLSNGDRIDYKDLNDGRHMATWRDPFAKPCYLFALVAGKLGIVEDNYITKSGKKVDLQIFCDPGNEPKCTHAMESLKRAMKWDEDTFGLEYDLNTFMLVAVDSFNFGAMENKGLNIFNSAYALANRETATDHDFIQIEAVVGHEYFHNWSGDRVTCRDWFQLTLKEGLTVFRDEEFTADMNSRPVKRIEDVKRLRQIQFGEDSGPNSHPIQPKEYIEIDNFYTATVYRKGSEIIRMIHTLIGEDNFKKGITKYFELFDGQAVTTGDFLHAMHLVSGFDFAQFKNWYDQAGTPELDVTSSYNPETKEYELTVTQSCPDTPGQTNKKPFYMPLSVGLIDLDGHDLDLRLKGESGPAQKTKVLHLSKAEQSFVFKDIPPGVTPSLLRGFSAPVKLDYNYSDSELAFLLANDSDPFNRYEAGQRLALNTIRSSIAASKAETATHLIEAFGALLKDGSLDPAFKAEVLNLPMLELIVAGQRPIDYDSADKARTELMKEVASTHEQSLIDTCQKLERGLSGSFKLDPLGMGQRKLKNIILEYLTTLEKDEHFKLAFTQFKNATNMTEQFCALKLLADSDCPERIDALSQFYNRFHKDPLVMDKWFTAQAGAKRSSILDDIRNIEIDPVFDRTNPNRLRALYGTFAQNYTRFHDISGEGYKFLADKIIEIDKFNPNVAARLTTQFSRIADMDSSRKALMTRELERIKAQPKLSKGVFEIVTKSIASADSKA